MGFSFLIPTFGRWRLFTRGRIVPISSPPGIHSLEYFRYFVPNKGAIVFDVGGELGLEAEQFAIMVGEAGKVFTFECFPNHIERLKILSKTHGNITVIEKACWNESGEITFYEGYTAGSNTAVLDATGQLGQPLANKSAGSINVTACTLDELWDTITGRASIDFLKMDIEGAELEALEGASEMLKFTNKVVVAAYHFRNGEKTATKVHDILEKAGFIVQIDDNFHVYGHRQ